MGQDYMDRTYKTINNGTWGCIAEFPTTNPIGVKYYETGSCHTCGDGDMAGGFDPPADPSIWYYYFVGKDGPWIWTEPNMRDYTYIIDAGFEETDRNDSILGEQLPLSEDCNEPLVMIEFENDQLLKNPSVEFRKNEDPNVDLDRPWDWMMHYEGQCITRMGELTTGSPNEPNNDGSFTGWYCLVIDPKGSYGHWQQWVGGIKANTEYYFGFAFYGKIPYPQEPNGPYARFEVVWLDAGNNEIRTDRVHLPYGDWTGIGWQWGWEDHTSPANAVNMLYRISMKASSDYWVYLDQMYAVEKKIENGTWTNPNPNMRSSFQIYDYKGNRHCDMYLDNELVVQNVSSTWNPIPLPYFVKTKQTFQSMRTASRHEAIMGHNLYKYTMDSADWQIKANKFGALRNYHDLTAASPKYNFPSYDWYEPMYQTTWNYGDEWYWNRTYRYPYGTPGKNDDYRYQYEYNSIYDYKYGDTDWYFGPLYRHNGSASFRDTNNHVYRSKVLTDFGPPSQRIGGPEFFMEGFDQEILGWPVLKIGHWKHPISLSMVAMHYMNKYNNPNYVFNYWGKGNATPAGLLLGPNYGPSPAGYVMQYWYSNDTGLRYPSDAGSPGSALFTATNQALCLEALAELGYGFNYPVARQYADHLARIICDIQWGNPESTGKALHFGQTEAEGWVHRPDCTGGFIIVYRHGSGYKASEDAYWFDMLVDFWWGMPKETLASIPVNQESQLCVRALQIYDWYAFKKDGATNSGRFPRLQISEDVYLADGNVDMVDTWYMATKYGKNQGDHGWDPLCDINLDKKIDMYDSWKVSCMYGRTSL